ncbi:carboxylate--amine ligase [Neobacillus sp. C211]|uniref:carboxylate--amine ligase n=1 Tax=unclassified Neobacillus TaxID=2675272 RepID=UPI00397B2C97
MKNNLVKRKKVLVLGHDNRSFLCVIRSLGRAQIEVHVAWHRNVEAIYSKYVHKIHDIPPFKVGEKDWLDAMVNVLKEEMFDLVIPCHDSSIIPLQKYQYDLQKYAEIYTINDKAYSVLFNKINTNQLARELGINLPRELIVTNLEEIDKILANFDFPIVIKPVNSCTEQNLFSKHFVKKAYTEKDLHNYLQESLKAGPVIIQENFIGYGVGIDLLLKDGQPLMTFQHIRVHEPLHGGGSSYRKSSVVHPELLEASLKIMKELNYSGVAMVEFLYNPKTNDWIFVEVNARFWGSLPLAVAAGANFPLALFNMMVDGELKFPQTYRKEIYCRNIKRDLSWQVENLRADHLDPTLATRPILKIIKETLFNLFSLRERYDEITMDDPKPGIIEVKNMIREMWLR